MQMHITLFQLLILDKVMSRIRQLLLKRLHSMGFLKWSSHFTIVMLLFLAFSEINECASDPIGSNPCLENSTCVDSIGRYQCICPEPDAFAGEYCIICRLLSQCDPLQNFAIHKREHVEISMIIANCRQCQDRAVNNSLIDLTVKFWT